MSVPFQPWIIRPDGTLVIEDFCRYGTEDCRFFTVDSVALPTGSSQILFTRYMTCTHCGEIDLISRPMLELPPSGYAVYHVIWKRPPSPDVDGRLRTLDIWMVANSRRMAYEVTFGKWRGITTVPGARCFIDGEEYDNGRPSFAQMLKWHVPRGDVSRLMASRPRWQARQGKAGGEKTAPVVPNRGDIILENGFIRCAPPAITVVKNTKLICNEQDLYRLLTPYERDPYFNRYHVVDQQNGLKLLLLYDIHRPSIHDPSSGTTNFVLDVSKYEDQHHILVCTKRASDNLRVYDLVRRLRHLLLDAESKERRRLSGSL